MQRGSASGTRIQPNGAPFSETTSLQAGNVYIMVYNNRFISMTYVGYSYHCIYSLMLIFMQIHVLIPENDNIFFVHSINLYCIGTNLKWGENFIN